MSSSGRFEDLSYADGFTEGLESIAHFLAYGPQGQSAPSKRSASRIEWGWGLDSGPANVWAAGPEKFLHAAAFFSRAYTQPTPDEQHEGTTFSADYTRESVIAIQELLECFNPQRQPSEWQFESAYAQVSSQLKWALEDKKWADKIISICRTDLQFLYFSRYNPATLSH